jgi:hypothetical protein
MRVTACGRVDVEADDRDVVEGIVRASITSPVQPVTVGLARRGEDGRGAADGCERGLVADSAGFVTEREQQLGGGDAADTCGLQDRGDQRLQRPVVIGDLPAPLWRRIQRGRASRSWSRP